MIGKTLSHYKVIEKIGQGGMGEVYRAEDTNPSREVAIFVILMLSVAFFGCTVRGALFYPRRTDRPVHDFQPG